MQEGHEPASCENWKDWFDKTAEIKPEECKDKYCSQDQYHFLLVKGTEEEEEIAANCLWLVTNSKKCPNCSISIQKNEGELPIDLEEIRLIFSLSFSRM